MRSTLLSFCVLCFSFSLFAQVPTFSSDQEPARLSPAVLQALGKEFTKFEAVRFEEAPLQSFLSAAAGETQLRLELGSYAWDMQLEPFEVRTDDYVLRVASDDGIKTMPRSQTMTYRGHVLGKKAAEVRLTIVEDFVYGMVAFADEAVFFQSQWLSDPTAAKDALIIFNGKDGILPDDHTCSLEGDAPHNHEDEVDHGAESSGQRSAVGQCFEVEVAIASAFDMFQAYGSVGVLEARNLGVMANVQTDYVGRFADDYIFVVVEQFVATSSAADPWTSSNDAGTLLNSFTNWGPGGFSNRHDIGQIWTDRDFTGTTIGVAWLNGLCSGSRYQALQDFTTSANFTRVLVSHELGHNFSCRHDAGGSPFIMAPAVQSTTTWSNTSINSVNAFAPNRSCLSLSAGCGGGSTPPVAAFTGNPTNVCEGQTVTFTSTSSGASTYSWSFPGGTPATSTSQNPTVTYNTTGTYDVTLTVSNSAGNDTRFRNNYITVQPLPIVDFNVTTSGSLDIALTNLTTGATSYQWSFGDGSTSTDFEPTHTYSTPGTYNVLLAAFNGCGSRSLTKQVVLTVPPIASWTSTDPMGCAPHNVQFTDQSSGTIVGYQWTFPGGNPSTSTQANPSVNYPNPGVYDVTLTVGNSAGNDVMTRTTYVVVGELPIAGFSVSQNGNQVNVVDQSAGALSVSYAFGDGTTSTVRDAMHVYASGGTYTIEQTVTNDCGSATLSQSVSVDGTPQASFDPVGQVCIGQPVTIPSTSTGNPTAYTWTINQPDGTTIIETGDPLVFTPVVRGTYAISLMVSNPSGQTTFSLVDPVVVLAAPTTSFTSASTGNQLDVTGQVSPVLGGASATYTWDFGDGTSGAGRQTTHTYSTVGTYQVMLTANNGCESVTTTESVTVGSAPTASVSVASSSGVFCPNGLVNLNATVSGSASSVTWTLPGASPDNPTGTNVNVSYAMPGNYSVEVEVCNAVGCNRATLAGGISVQPIAVAGFTVAGAGGLTVAVTNGSVGGTTVTYDYGESGSTPSASTSYTYASPGTYTITQTVLGPCGTDTRSETISVGQAPVADFTSNRPSSLLCPGGAVDFTDSSTGLPSSYSWSFPGGTPATSTEANPSVVYAAEGVYDVVLTVTNALGTNTVSRTAYVSVAPEPMADFSETTTGLSVSFAGQVFAPTVFAWDFGDGTSASGQNPNHIYTATGTYSVTLTVSTDCGTDQVVKTVSVLAAPTALASPGASQGCPGLSVAFSAAGSTDVGSYAWSFPGGSPAVSTAANPTVAYATAGTYDVRLIVSNATGVDTMTLTDAVTVAPEAVAAFGADVNTLTVTLTNQSTNANTLRWSFGDGSTSMDTNPVHTYAVAGTYTVRLEAENDCGVDVFTQSVSVAPDLPNAAINLVSSPDCAPAVVSLSASQSTSADSYLWLLPGASPATSTEEAPSVNYFAPGDYDVTLIVTNVTGTDTLTLADFVSVGGPPQTTLQAPTVTGLSIALMVTAPGATQLDYNFGDGTSLADGGTDVTHTYSDIGQYEIIVTSSNGCGTVRDTVEVVVGMVPNTEFVADVLRGCAPLVVSLTDQTMGSPNAWVWTVTSPSGAALTSTVQNPAFTLNEVGFYTVSLSSTNAVGSATEVSVNFLEVVAEPSLSIAIDSAQSFFVRLAATANEVDSIRWDFGDGATGTGDLPLHTYAAAGTYEVIAQAFGLCGIARDTVTVTIQTSSLSDLPAGATLRAVPNPFQAVLRLTLTGIEEAFTLQVIDALGRVVYADAFTTGKGLAFRQNLPVEALPAGVYTLRVAGRTFERVIPLVKAN